MAHCKTCGAPVNLAPDGDPRYLPPRSTVPTLTEALRCPEVAGLVEALKWYESHRLDAVARSRSIHAPEDAAVLDLCKKHGFGAVIDSACRQWAWMPQGGTAAFFVGGCIGDETAAAALAAIEKVR